MSTVQAPASRGSRVASVVAAIGTAGVNFAWAWTVDHSSVLNAFLYNQRALAAILGLWCLLGVLGVAVLYLPRWRQCGYAILIGTWLTPVIAYAAVGALASTG